jgi:uncharacterized protein with PQ loop repeat
MNETLLGFIVASWGIVMALSPVIQIRRMMHRRSSRDVSIGYLSVLVVGFAIWIAYGVAIDNPALIVPNAVAFVVGGATIGVARHFRHEVGADPIGVH